MSSLDRRRFGERQASGKKAAGSPVHLSLQQLEDRCLLSAANLASYGALPLAFEPNVGQTSASANFLAHGSGYSLFLAPGQATLELQNAGESQAIGLRLVGANSAAQGQGLDLLPGVSNYLIGNDPSQWHLAVPNYARVEYQNVYPGVDLVFFGNQGRLEYDLVVQPGARIDGIHLSFSGVQALSLDSQGNLVLHASSGNLAEEAPMVYQEIGGVRRAIAVRYVIQNDQQVQFAVGAHDANVPLVIDPVLSYSTYLGGSGANGESGNAIAVDAAGEAFVTGFTTSTDFPTVGPLQGRNNGAQDVFVAKFNASGTALVYSTYLGGSDVDIGNGIAVDSKGDAYVTGQTSSSDFPVFNALQSSLKGGQGQVGGRASNAFIAALNPSGNGFLYSTYLGGSGFGSRLRPTIGDWGNAIAVDSAGEALVTGVTNSSNFPVMNAEQPAWHGAGNGTSNAFVAKLSASGTSLVYSTYLGGSGAFGGLGAGGGDVGAGIAVDAAGDAVVTGSTASTDFPTAGETESSRNGTATTGFVAKFTPSGGLSFSRYLGGSGGDAASGVALDGAGDAYITGNTASNNFPTFATSPQTTLAGPKNAFVAEVDSRGVLQFATYLGGSGSGGDAGTGIALDSFGDAYVTGFTTSSNFPTTGNAVQNRLNGTQNAFVTEVANGPGARPLLFSSYLGGSGSDRGNGIAVDSTGNIYLTGSTGSSNFPTTAGAFHQSINGSVDAFVTKLSSHQWEAESVAVSADDSARILWTTPTGNADLWAVTNAMAVTPGPTFGPLSGWSAVADAAGSDGVTRLLWRNMSGAAALWLVGSDGTFENAGIFGPISGWTVRDVAVGSDDQARILWTSTSGQAVVWTVSNSFSVTSGPVFGPFSGWQALKMAAGSDGLTRLLWTNTSGAAAVWLLDANNNSLSSAVYAPVSGWSAVDVTVGSDNQTRLLWTSLTQGSAIYDLNSSLTVSSATVYGAISGWLPVAISGGSDGVLRLLWDSQSGAAALWTLGNDGSLQNAGVFGPF
jgi:hypothetical protein